MRRILLGLLIGAVVLAATPAWARWVWRDGKWQYVEGTQTPPPAPAKAAPPPTTLAPPEKAPEPTPPAPAPPAPPAPPAVPTPPSAPEKAPEPSTPPPAPPTPPPDKAPQTAPPEKAPEPSPPPPAPKPEPKPEAPAPAEPKPAAPAPKVQPAEPAEPGFVPARPRTETLPPPTAPPAPTIAAPAPRPAPPAPTIAAPAPRPAPPAPTTAAPAPRPAPPAPTIAAPAPRPAPPVPKIDLAAPGTEPPAPRAEPPAPKRAPAAAETPGPAAKAETPEPSAADRITAWWNGLTGPGEENALFEKARSELSGKDYRAAARNFKAFIKSFQASRNREEAMWLRAAALWGLEDYMGAFDQYEELMANYAGSPHYRDALLKEIEIADLYFGPTRRKVLGIPMFSGETEAVEILRKVYEHQPTGDLASRVVQKIADYYWSKQQWAEAEDYYDKYCREYPNGPAARTAELRRAKCAIERCRGSRYDTTCLQLAYDRLRQFNQKFPEEAEREGVPALLAKIRQMQAEALYETAINYYRSGQPLAAAFYVERLQQKFPDTTWCEMSKQFMADISMKKEDIEAQADPTGKESPPAKEPPPGKEPPKPLAQAEAQEKPGPKEAPGPKEEPKP